jgi:hypothetical protein
MRWFALLVVFFLTTSSVADDAKIAERIEKIRAVQPKGENHAEAAKAARELQNSSVEHLPQIIAGMDGANPLATNWLRGVAESVASKHAESGGKLPVAQLEKLFADSKHAPRGRRLAYELIATVDPKAEERLIPGLQTDPSLELRYDAIRLAIEQAKEAEAAGDKEKAQQIYSQAFVHARDLEQTKAIAAKLKGLGETVDMPTRLGFVVRWQVIGPFENGGDKGWDVAYPPESEFDLKAEYQGQKGPVKWQEFATDDEYGLVDLNAGLDKHKGAIAYAAAEFIADREREVDIRIGCINANKVWVNGELVAANRVYHTGMTIDQYIGQAKLKPGKNLILVKVGQNEQTEDWAQAWQFQLRVCDSLGGPVLSQDRLVKKTAAR